MARRPAATTLMKKAIDDRDAHTFMWALLELSPLLEKPQDTSSSGVASLIEIEQYMKK
jgi:hypothetical protein